MKSPAEILWLFSNLGDVLKNDVPREYTTRRSCCICRCNRQGYNKEYIKNKGKIRKLQRERKGSEFLLPVVTTGDGHGDLEKPKKLIA